MSAAASVDQAGTTNLVTRDRLSRMNPGEAVEHLPRTLVSVTEAAGALGVSRSYAYELVNAGFLSSIRLGRRVLVPISALEDLIARGQDGI